MARLKSERKRRIILEAAKSLFGRQGFFNTSIQDIVKETGLPIGSIYTYFKGKEEIISTIVEEGWTMVHGALKKVLSEKRNPHEKLKSVVDRFLPVLLEDTDFISILLSEGLVYTRIAEKVETLTDALSGVMKEVSTDKRSMKAGLMVYFLGVLSAARVARQASIGLTQADLIAFTKKSIESGIGMKL
jgi:AcrR family transcriptional regulator